MPLRTTSGPARYRIPDPLDLWRWALDWVSALYSMIGKFLPFNRQRSPQGLHHTLNEFSALMRQQVPQPCWDQRVARRRTLHDPCLSPVRLQRRELASRSSGGAQWLAARLTNSPVTPNQISMLSVGWAALGSALLSWNPGWPAFIAAAVCVQQRLLCNLLDGMVAIEGGKSSATGTLFNEVPDRLSDALFLVPLGYPAGYPWLGWLAALLAVLTAFVRVLGGALGQPQNFGGILPKQRRMAVLTVALLVQAIEDSLWGSRVSLMAAAIIIVLGSLATCLSRTRRIAKLLQTPS
jgi:phosphatidylglycerophosphate synthase